MSASDPGSKPGGSTNAEDNYVNVTIGMEKDKKKAGIWHVQLLCETCGKSQDYLLGLPNILGLSMLGT